MTSALAGDELTFSTYAKSAKVQACLATGHATALVVRRAGDEIVRATCVSGPVRLREPGEQAGPGAMDVRDYRLPRRALRLRHRRGAAADTAGGAGDDDGASFQ
jgi:hypothetical protein